MNRLNASRAHLAIAFAFVVFWVVVLCASPLMRVSWKLAGWPNWQGTQIVENRELATRPDFRTMPVKEWGNSIEAWYSDSLPWRAWLIQQYRDLHFRRLKTGVLQQVPGEGHWIFRRGGTWPELDDYLGAFELTPEELDAWAELIEGRKAWAEAHGTRYLQVVTSVKAQIHAEKILPTLRVRRGVCVREQLEDRLEHSPTRENVLFTHDALLAAVAARDVFYEDDHHVNAYGVYVVFQAIVEKLAAWFPGIRAVPFYDEPPPDVLAGKTSGCYEDHRRLQVVVPGARTVSHSLLRLSGGSRHPQTSVAIHQPGEPRMLVIGHDSFLRFALYSWHRKEVGKVFLPFGNGFSEIISLMFMRYTTDRLDAIVAERVPDVIVEQFSECRLGFGPIGLDETMRRAAAFGRAEPMAGDAMPGQGVWARCVLENVTVDKEAEKIAGITVELLDGSEVVDAVAIAPGVRRAVFFKPVAPRHDCLSVRLRDGTAEKAELMLRAAAGTGSSGAIEQQK